MSHDEHPCHCGSPDCLVGEIGAAMLDYEDAGGDISSSRLLWCTEPGCRHFEIVDGFTHAIAHVDAKCLDHRVGGER